MAVQQRVSSEPPFTWLFQEPESESVAGPSNRWTPFRRSDNKRLEAAVAAGEPGPVAVECGRYDVDLTHRLRRAVYWAEPHRRVIRSSWFCGLRNGERSPYEEGDCEGLEAVFQRLRSGKAVAPQLVPVNRGRHDVRFERLPKDELEESSGVLSFFTGSSTSTEKRHLVADAVGEGCEYSAVQEPVDRSGDQTAVLVWRGPGPIMEKCMQEDEEDEEALPKRVECLVFVVHGIGQFQRFHNDSTAGFHMDVSKLRRTALNHLRQRVNERRQGKKAVLGRIEFLPLEWFESIHIDVGIGNRLRNVTLPSVAPLRDFANYAIADILVYQDDDWRERIHREIQQKIARLYRLFMQRTPDYTGEVVVVGHSLGAVIMFDVLQKVLPQLNHGLLSDTKSTGASPRRFSSLPKGAVQPLPGSAPSKDFGTPRVTEERDEITEEGIPLPQRISTLARKLELKETDCVDSGCQWFPAPRCFFAIGSPLGLFLSIRLSHKKECVHDYFRGLDVRWPSSKAGRGWRFFNIFHPDDPIAYRIEPLLNSCYADEPPRIVPHLGGIRWNHQVREFLGAVRSSTSQFVGQAKAIEDDSSADKATDVLLVHTIVSSTAASFLDESLDSSRGTAAVDRIDYALQETVFESMSEFVSAIQSHNAYWECEDMAHFIVDQCMGALDAPSQC